MINVIIYIYWTDASLIQHLRDLKQETFLFVGIFNFYEQLKVRAQLS